MALQDSQHQKYHSKAKFESLEDIKEEEKLPLQREYTIWVTMKQAQTQAQSYESILKPAATFKTVQDFWGIYSHFKRPTQMSFGTQVYIFADGVKPMWEVEPCKQGGRWSLRVPKTHTNKFWEDVLLHMIGELFSTENEVLGIALSLKPVSDNIQIWNRSGKNQTEIDTLKADINKFLNIDETTMKLEYENFEELLSRPKPEKKENFFARNKDHESTNDFDRNQMSRGGGFSRGRGRGRGGQNNQ